MKKPKLKIKDLIKKKQKKENNSLISGMVNYFAEDHGLYSFFSFIIIILLIIFAVIVYAHFSG